MDLLEAIRSRRSCRRFSPEAVSREALERIAEAATWAPSGKNRQNGRIFGVRGEARDRLAECGWLVFRVNKVLPEEVPPLESVKDKVAVDSAPGNGAASRVGESSDAPIRNRRAQR